MTKLSELVKSLSPEEIDRVFDQDLCESCHVLIRTRFQSLCRGTMVSPTLSDNESTKSDSSGRSAGSSIDRDSKPFSDTLKFAQKRDGYATQSPASVNSKGSPLQEQNELARIAKVGRKKDFCYYERIDGKKMNMVQGLELHTGVFNSEEQKEIVDFVYKLQRMGQNGQLRDRTYTEPSKWMRGKGRVTIQFGCCYNYAVDKHGNPPGIIRDEDVDPLPPLFKQMIKRLVRWRVLPSTCVPNSCIVNIYDKGDCIPPHIDHHDFVRPFCTISFLAEANILFGSSLKTIGPGEFSGPVSISLPVGSVLVLNGNGADVAKHCVPAVPAKRISITFRKMDESKIPYHFRPDAELQGLRPLLPEHKSASPHQQPVMKNEGFASVVNSTPLQNSPHYKDVNNSNNSPTANSGIRQQQQVMKNEGFASVVNSSPLQNSLHYKDVNNSNNSPTANSGMRPVVRSPYQQTVFNNEVTPRADANKTNNSFALNKEDEFPTLGSLKINGSRKR